MVKKQSLAVSVICFVLCFIALKAYGLTIFVNSPYPDYWFGGDKTNGWRFDYTYGDKQAIPLNDIQITKAERITLIPPYDLCTDMTTCRTKIKQVDFHLNNEFRNTEMDYPYDFKHDPAASGAEDPDTFPENGYYTMKAIITLIDDSKLEMYCQFIWGDVKSQQIDLVLHYFTTDNTVKFNWKKGNDPDDLAESWDIYLWHMEHEEKVFETNVVAEENVDVYSLGFMLPKTGHYLIYIRSRRALVDSFIQRVNESTELEKLKGTIGGIDYEDGGVCDIPKWWDDTAELDAMKAKVLEVNALCSRWEHSGNADLGAVKSKATGELEKQGWWLYGFVAPPSDAVIE